MRGLKLRTLRMFSAAAAVAVGMAFAEVSDCALAKAAGGSGNSGTLSSNKAIRKQQLICDPDYPTNGSTSVVYDPSIVSFAGLSFGPGYAGFAQIEVGGDGNFLIDLANFVPGQNIETGYIQVSFYDPQLVASAAAVAPLVDIGSAHGQIAPPAGYVTVDNDGPAAVDTHALLFNYLPNVPDSTVAEYTVYSDDGSRGSSPDYFAGFDDDLNYFRVEYDQIASATVRGSLNAVPLPPAVLLGGLTMLGSYGVSRLRRRQTA